MSICVCCLYLRISLSAEPISFFTISLLTGSEATLIVTGKSVCPIILCSFIYFLTTFVWYDYPIHLIFPRTTIYNIVSEAFLLTNPKNESIFLTVSCICTILQQNVQFCLDLQIILLLIKFWPSTRNIDRLSFYYIRASLLWMISSLLI